MTTAYAQHVSSKRTPQSEPIPLTTQVPNSAGGYAFPVDCWTRLDRFLVLGCADGTYYASERKLTQEAAACVLECAKASGARTVTRITDISQAGRAPKNDPAIFALALIASQQGQEFAAAKELALDAMPLVCRTGTHLFQFVAACNELRGWGRGLRTAIAKWYRSRSPEQTAYQVTKYQSREGWSHRDLCRLSHPKCNEPLNSVLHWCVKGWPGIGEHPPEQAALVPIWAFERAKAATTESEVVNLIREYNLPRECIPTQWLKSAAVWDALLERMPLTAMVRNLATMTRVGLLAPLSAGTSRVLTELSNADRIKQSRIHPVAILAAMLTYKAGRGERSQHTWTPVPQIVNALDAAFYLSFGNVTATGKRWLLALDVSGSMNMGQIAGVPGLSPRVGSAALALVTAAVEPLHHFVAFTSNGACLRPSMHAGYPSGITPLTISPRQRIDDVCNEVSRLPMGGTDCALPMLYAEQQGIPVDVFVVLTDNETWAGAIHPCQALRQYRQRTGIPAKLVVVGMTATGFSIADPNDSGTLDVVGFDTATPQLISDFAAN